MTFSRWSHWDGWRQILVRVFTLHKNHRSYTGIFHRKPGCCFFLKYGAVTFSTLCEFTCVEMTWQKATLLTFFTPNATGWDGEKGAQKKDTIGTTSKWNEENGKGVQAATHPAGLGCTFLCGFFFLSKVNESWERKCRLVQDNEETHPLASSTSCLISQKVAGDKEEFSKLELGLSWSCSARESKRGKAADKAALSGNAVNGPEFVHSKVKRVNVN